MLDQKRAKGKISLEDSHVSTYSKKGAIGHNIVKRVAISQATFKRH
jgi:hypothetical protein